MSDQLNGNRDLILQEERVFARAVAVSAIDKPQTSFWLVVLPILFLYYAYRIQKYKKSLARFVEDFMVTRNRAMELAWEQATTGKMPAAESIEGVAALDPALQRPYCTWLVALAEYYGRLLRQSGTAFPELVRGGYRNRSEYLLALNRLNGVEKEFYSALRPRMATIEGTSEVISRIEKTSRTLRRDLAERVFS